MENNNNNPFPVNITYGNNMSKEDIDNYFRNLPPGYRNLPTDDELVDCLFRKVNNIPLPINRIHVVDFYSFHPQELADAYKRIRDHQWFFFTSRYRKYPNGRRPNRAAGDGYWKPTGTDKSISGGGPNPKGYKKSLDYYEGKHPSGTKTIWKMHEYTLIAPSSSTTAKDKMKLDDWVLCKMYKNRSNRNRDELEETSDEEDFPESARVVNEPGTSCQSQPKNNNDHETTDDYDLRLDWTDNWWSKYFGSNNTV